MSGYDAVLNGHDAWVYSVRWAPNKSQLLTASMDKSVIVWQQDQQSGVWLENARLGDIGGQMAGFFGAVYSPESDRILAHGYQGGLYLWKLDAANDCWHVEPVFGGHSTAVEDICWEPSGQFLLSCGHDQTTRLYSIWRREGQKPEFVQISRPQVHGHQMQCLSFVSSTCFVSGAEEKIFRAFSAPRLFVGSLANISGTSAAEMVSAFENDLPEGASIPSLGLSNKAMNKDEVSVQNQISGPKEGIQNFTYNPSVLTAPPTENDLMQNTLWPEIYKLYGHGYEVFSVTANRAGTVLATSCKASKLEHAAILLWDTGSWEQRTRLEAHNLTVTDMHFSPNDSYLLSVSRDRTWALFERTGDDFVWRKSAQSDKKSGVHSRIIWSCAWSHDSKYFFTGSRDKKVVCWQMNQSGPRAVGHQSMNDSVTALDLAPDCLEKHTYLLAVGLENGKISVHTWSSASGEYVLRSQLNQNIAHCGTVKRLAFRPTAGSWAKNDKSPRSYQLASCGADAFVNVYSVQSPNDGNQ